MSQSWANLFLGMAIGFVFAVFIGWCIAWKERKW